MSGFRMGDNPFDGQDDGQVPGLDRDDLELGIWEEDGVRHERDVFSPENHQRQIIRSLVRLLTLAAKFQIVVTHLHVEALDVEAFNETGEFRTSEVLHMEVQGTVEN